MTREMILPVDHLVNKLRALSNAVSGWSPLPATHHDLKELEHKIMSKITELEAQNAAVTAEILEEIQGVLTEIQGTHDAVKSLDEMITKFQNSPGALTPEDQAAIDRIQAKNKEVLTSLKTLREKSQTLREDAATPPTPTSDGIPHQG